MTHGATPSRTARPSAAASGTGLISRRLRLAALALAIAVLAAAVMVIPGWIPLLPRSVRRALVEVLLRTILIVYCVVFLTSFAGTPLLGWLLARARRGRQVRPAVARGFLISLSCLASLVLLELGSTGWRAWMHRLPALPAKFVAAPPEECRIVVLGGSSAWVSRTAPGCRWARSSPGGCSRRSPAGGSSARSWHGWAIHWRSSITSWPHWSDVLDAVIIYSGHNEFAARFEEERDAVAR